MLPAAGEAVQGDRTPAVVQPPPMEELEEDATTEWFRGEFAAADAIIDALCRHLTELHCGAAEDYASVFAAIRRRRLNWKPLIQMQKYYSVADVTWELKKVGEMKRKESDVKFACCTSTFNENEKDVEKSSKSCVEIKRSFHRESEDKDGGGGGDETADDLPPSDITDSGSQEVLPLPEHVGISFVAYELVNEERMVNVLSGLQLFEDIFTDPELSQLKDFVNDLRMAGQKDELSGDTFVLYNQQMKGNKREMVQLGVPIFDQIKEDATDKFQKCNIMPIPGVLQGVIDRLIQCNLIPQNREPNGCIINFFDEGGYSQPFTKPPHLDPPVSILLLSESRMVFGHSLFGNGEGIYGGPLILTLKKGSLLVMGGDSSERARHAMCSSDNKRVSITFFRVHNPQIETESKLSKMSLLSGAMTLRQPIIPVSYPRPTNIIPQWGILVSAGVMWAPYYSVAVSPTMVPQGGTGVFQQQTVGVAKTCEASSTERAETRSLSLPSPHDSDTDKVP